jgi:hypothetical protein
MVAEPIPVDVDSIPGLAALAEEVRRTGTPRLLRRDGEDVALLMPPARPKRRRRKPTPEEALRALEASFGAWKGLVDGEQLKRDLKASRGNRRPPVQL